MLTLFLPHTRARQATALICCALLGSITAALAQPLRFDHLSMEQGLSESVVLAVAQDDEGFMWFGTADGLNRWDGYAFTAFHSDAADSTSLSNNYVTALQSDGSGGLWVATLGGLNWYDRVHERFHRYAFEPRGHDGAVTPPVKDPASDAFWLGAGSVLYRLSVQRHGPGSPPELSVLDRFRADTSDPQAFHGRNVTQIAFDAGGRLWVGTADDGVEIFDPHDRTFRHLVHDPADRRSLSHNFINTLLLDTEGMMWVGTEGGGVNRCDPHTLACTRYVAGGSQAISHNVVRSLAQGEDGRIWIGSDGGGIDVVDPSANMFQHIRHDAARLASLASDRIVSMYTDRAGTRWFGTWGSGVDRTSPSKAKFPRTDDMQLIMSRLGSRFVISIFEDSRGWLWIGSHGGGLVAYDPRARTTHRFAANPSDPHSLSDNTVWAIREDRNGILWLATDRGVNTYDRRTNRFSRFRYDPGQANALTSRFSGRLYPDSSGDVVWVSSNIGVDRIDARTGAIRKFYYADASPDVAEGFVTGGYRDAHGVIWLGTTPLLTFDTKTERFVRRDLGLGRRLVSFISEDTRGRLWIGTFGDGVFVFHHDSLVWHLREADGLPNNVVYGALEDSRGNVWLSTNRGLARLDIATMTFRNYDIDDGLQSNEFNRGACWQGRDGRMYFGGVNGFDAFFPDSVLDNRHVPPVVITGFRTFDEPAPLPRSTDAVGEIRLRYDENFFSFEYAALDYTDPSKNRYAYKLEGFDQRWVDAGQRRLARYTNVEPGEYTFRVKGSNNDGIWNESGAAIRIVIPPPFWKTAWFMTGLLLLSAGIFGGGVRYVSVRKLKSRLRDLEHQQQLQEERERISRDLHDHVGAQLVSIISGLELVEKYSSVSDRRVERLLASLRDDARTSITQLRETIWAIKSSGMELGRFAEHVEAYARRQLEFKDGLRLAFSMTGHSSHLLTPIEVLNCFRIIQEALTNCLKHSAASMVTIDIASGADGTLRLKITNGGVAAGGEAADTLGGNGLANMRRRAEELGGSCQAGPDTGGLWVVDASIPIR